MEKKYDERDMFEQFVRVYGKPAPAHQVLGPDDFLTDGGDCWTAAWRYAQSIGATYVEGGCTLPADPDAGFDKPRRVRAHAWVERQGPFGLQVVELTRGYEGGRNYRGVAVNCDPSGDVAKSTAPWVNERGSVIEAFFVAGLPPAQIVSAIS